METIYVSEKIKIINDSKSTNGESTAAALSSFSIFFGYWEVNQKMMGLEPPKNI